MAPQTAAPRIKHTLEGATPCSICPQRTACFGRIYCNRKQAGSVGFER